MFLIRLVLAFGWLKNRYDNKELSCIIKITMISAVLAMIFRRALMSRPPFKNALIRRQFGLIDNFQTLGHQPCAQDEQEQSDGQRDNGRP